LGVHVRRSVSIRSAEREPSEIVFGSVFSSCRRDEGEHAWSKRKASVHQSRARQDSFERFILESTMDRLSVRHSTNSNPEYLCRGFAGASSCFPPLCRGRRPDARRDHDPPPRLRGNGRKARFMGACLRTFSGAVSHGFRRRPFSVSSYPKSGIIASFVVCPLDRRSPREKTRGHPGSP